MEINSASNFNTSSNFQSNVGFGNGVNASSLTSGNQSSFGGLDIQKLASSLIEAVLTGNFSPELLKDLAKLMSPVEIGALLAELDKLLSGEQGTGNAVGEGTQGNSPVPQNASTSPTDGETGSNNRPGETQSGNAPATAAPTPSDSVQTATTLPSPAPNSANLPSAEAIAKDPVVAAAIEKAWNNSNPNTPGAKQEQGFWVMRDDKTGALSTVNFPSNGTRDSLTPGAVPAIEGKSAVAFFHTHPNTAAEGYKSGPSPADQNFADAVGIPGIIRSHDGMYYFGANN